MNLCCLHLHQYATVARPYYNLAFALPLTVERRRGRPTGSVRVDTSTRRELSAFEQNTGYTTRGREQGAGRRDHLHPPGADAGASAGALAEAVRRHQAEVAAPK